MPDIQQEHRYRHAPDMKRVDNGVHKHHVPGASIELVTGNQVDGENLHPLSKLPPHETEGNYEHQVGLGEQGIEQINAGNGNPRSTGEAAPTSAGMGKSTHKSRLTEGGRSKGPENDGVDGKNTDFRPNDWHDRNSKGPEHVDEAGFAKEEGKVAGSNVGSGPKETGTSPRDYKEGAGSQTKTVKKSTSYQSGR